MMMSLENRMFYLYSSPMYISLMWVGLVSWFPPLFAYFNAGVSFVFFLLIISGTSAIVDLCKIWKGRN